MCTIEERECLLSEIKIENAESAQSKWEVISVKDQSKLLDLNESTVKIVSKCKSVDDIAHHNGYHVAENGITFSKSTNYISVCNHSPTNKNELVDTYKNKSRKCMLVKSCNSLRKDSKPLHTRSSPMITTPVADKKSHHLCEESSGSGEVTVKLQHVHGYIFHEDIGPHQIYPRRSYETSQSSESVICRICHSSGDDKLISPCKCDGSTRYVHASCLVTWFKKSVKNQCELCKSDVKIRKINHNLTVWRKPEDRPIPLIWFSVFFIGLFLNILSIYVNASESCDSTACLIFYVVNGFGIILDAAFLWFWFLKCKHYWKKWCALNQDWFIDDLEEANELSVEFVRNQTEAVV